MNYIQSLFGVKKEHWLIPVEKAYFTGRQKYSAGMNEFKFVTVKCLYCVSVISVRPGSHVQVVPTSLGQGKDYFDEMFRDLTRETLYTQTRPKSSPLERPPSGTRERPGSAVRDRTAFQDR